MKKILLSLLIIILLPVMKINANEDKNRFFSYIYYEKKENNYKTAEIKGYFESNETYVFFALENKFLNYGGNEDIIIKKGLKVTCNKEIKYYDLFYTSSSSFQSIYLSYYEQSDYEQYLKNNLYYFNYQLFNDFIDYFNLNINYGNKKNFVKNKNDYYYESIDINLDSNFTYFNYILQSLKLFNFYELEELNLKPAISGVDTIINNVSNPYTLEEIKEYANLKSFDEYDGDITNKIKIKEDTYSNNKNILGTFYLLFESTNSYGLSTEYKLLIYNKDFDKPVISGPDSTTISYKNELNIEELLNKFTVSDNYDKNLKINIESNNYQKNKVGTYDIILSASDSSANKKEFIHKVLCVDDIKPYFKDNTNGVIELNFKDEINNDILLTNLEAYDEIDGNITSKIKIISNTIKEGIIGNYTVIYEVTDKNNNKETYERKFNIITTTYPTFYASKNLISIENINKLSTDDIVTIISNYENIKVKKYEILENEYLGNENKIGIYKIKLKITNEHDEDIIYTRDINVFEKKEENNNNYLSLIITSISLFLLIIILIKLLIINKRKKI